MALYGRVGMLVITNGLTEVQRPRLANSAIGAYIDGVVVSDEVGVSKPDPGILDIAFQKMGQPAREEVLMPGSSKDAQLELAHLWSFPSSLGRVGSVAPPARGRILSSIRSYF